MLFNVQCLNGHVFDAPNGSDLEARCIEREERGFLDALPVPPSDCPECRRARAEDNAILDEAAAMEAYMFDPRHPNAVNRYLEGDCLD